MKVLVTGGCGFIGSHLVDALVDKGHQVIVVDDCSANNEKFYFNDKAVYHKVSICEADKLTKLFKNCEFVFHLAAESRLQDSINNPRRTVAVNVMGTLNVLEACVENKVKGILFSSTSSVYGLTEELPIKETLKEDCLNPYAATKYSAELLIRNYTKLYKLKSCIFRYFNVFGERAPTTGQYALVTGIFLRQIKNNQPLTIVGNGLQERDFIYVKDIVDANIISMENWDKTEELTQANIFNIGSGYTVNIITLAKAISDNYVFIPERKGEAKNNLSCSKKFMELTGWKPKTKILEWIKNF